MVQSIAYGFSTHECSCVAHIRASANSSSENKCMRYFRIFGKMLNGCVFETMHTHPCCVHFSKFSSNQCLSLLDSHEIISEVSEKANGRNTHTHKNWTMYHSEIRKLPATHFRACIHSQTGVTLKAHGKAWSADLQGDIWLSYIF